MTTGEGYVPRSPVKGARYRLVVSFGSVCCGTDQQALTKLDSVLAGYSVGALGETRSHWGKEGEYDVCFTLDGLSAADRTRFVTRVKTEMTSKLVDVHENAACHAER